MTINGLPAHILLVHAVVVLVPLSALAVVLVAIWSRARSWALPVAGLTVLSTILVPVTTQAGEWLEHRVSITPLVRAHTQLGDSLTPWVLGLSVVAIVLARRQRQIARSGSPTTAVGEHGPGSARAVVGAPTVLASRAATVALMVLGAIGTVITVERIGDSGAQAVWSGNFTVQPQFTRAP